MVFRPEHLDELAQNISAPSSYEPPLSKKCKNGDKALGSAKIRKYQWGLFEQVLARSPDMSVVINVLW